MFPDKSKELKIVYEEILAIIDELAMLENYNFKDLKKHVKRTYKNLATTGIDHDGPVFTRLFGQYKKVRTKLLERLAYVRGEE